MKLKNVLVVYMRSSLPNHKKTCDIVRHVLKKNKIKAKFMRRRDNMDKEIFMNHDLILVIGGDGSFLRVTHHMTQHIPLLGINSDVKKKEGFFMRANMSDFESKFKKILSGKFRTIELPRLHTIINKKIIDDFALNEIYIGQKKAYKVARFTMKIGKKQEFQKVC